MEFGLPPRRLRLGAHVLFRLLQEETPVRALHRNAASLAMVKDIFGHYTDNPAALMERIHWVQGDILDIPSLEIAMDGVTEVYHVAAAVSFDPKDREWMDKVNVEGTANVVNLCLDQAEVRLCHVSSVAAIGRTEKQDTISEATEWKPSSRNSNYGVSKHKAEMEVWRGIAEGLEAVIVNPCIILGPGNWNQSSAALFTKVWNGLPYYTQGVNAMVDARDVAEVLPLPRTERYLPETMNELQVDHLLEGIPTDAPRGLRELAPQLLDLPRRHERRQPAHLFEHAGECRWIAVVDLLRCRTRGPARG
jgi:nucleoside-diphosphate-sugar epimerase